VDSFLALLSAFEGHLMKKGDEVTQELVLRSPEGASIFLFGMMACGKSTVGRIVSNALNYEFFDRYLAMLVKNCMLWIVCCMMYQHKKIRCL